ncbi:MAG TPA: DUF4395 domain-containing protein [bacterium]|jgi:hypothetical protein|nr:DUF4395 domain-containing protein [bacterium]
MKVDHNSIKFSQVSLTVLALAAFVTDAGWLVGILALIMAISTAVPGWGAFRAVYRYAALPSGLLRPNVVDDDPAPHRFAQGVGAVFLGASWIALATGTAALGWALTLIVAALAMLNVVFNFCAGCFVYYQLRRYGLVRREA